METVADRIVKLVDVCCGGNRSEFARRIDLTPAYISIIDKERDRMPSERTLSDISDEFKVNIHWLKTGEGEMFKRLDRESEIINFVKSLSPNSELDQFKLNVVSNLVKLNETEWIVFSDFIEKLSEK